MKRSALLAAICFLVAFPAMVSAQATNLDTWIDADFDGSPDTSTEMFTVGVMDSFAIYIDPTGFPVPTWTNFLYFFPIGPYGAADSSMNWFSNIVNVRYDVPGGSIFPVDDFSRPFLLGLGGSGFSQSAETGPFRLAVVTVTPIRSTAVGGACIAPLVDPYNPYYVFVQLGNTVNYGTFQDGDVDSSCVTIEGGNAADQTSWGRLKGLYK